MITPRDYENAQQQTHDMQQPTGEPTSPWTELFQRSHATAQASRMDQQPQAQHPADADADHSTRDALSAIFNGD